MIIYIMGTGRSGSTLLDILLGSSAGIFGGGEISQSARAYANNEYCSCRNELGNCEIWSQIIEKWALKSPKLSLSEFFEFQNQLARMRSQFSLRRKIRKQDSDFRILLQAIRVFYELIKDVSGKPIVVDSSKAPGRALLLSAAFGPDFRVIHLTRDCRGVCQSYTKSFEANPEGGVFSDLAAKPIHRTALKWSIGNSACLSIKRHLNTDQYMHLRYEDLTRDSVGSVKTIGKFINVDLDDLLVMLRKETPFNPFHLVSGNRLRMKRNITIMPASKWRNDLRRREVLIATAISFPLLRALGYNRMRLN